jgi:hypothetical protein
MNNGFNVDLEIDAPNDSPHLLVLIHPDTVPIHQVPAEPTTDAHDEEASHIQYDGDGLERRRRLDAATDQRRSGKHANGHAYDQQVQESSPLRRPRRYRDQIDEACDCADDRGHQAAHQRPITDRPPEGRALIQRDCVAQRYDRQQRERKMNDGRVQWVTEKTQAARHAQDSGGAES